MAPLKLQAKSNSVAQIAAAAKAAPVKAATSDDTNIIPGVDPLLVRTAWAARAVSAVGTPMFARGRGRGRVIVARCARIGSATDGCAFFPQLGAAWRTVLGVRALTDPRKFVESQFKDYQGSSVRSWPGDAAARRERRRSGAGLGATGVTAA